VEREQLKKNWEDLQLKAGQGIKESEAKFISDIQGLNDRVTQLQKEKEELIVAADTVKRSLSNFNTSAEGLKGEIVNLEQEKISLQEKLLQALNDLKKIEQAIPSMMAEVRSSLTTKITLLEEENEALQDQLNVKESQHMMLNQEVKKLNQKIFLLGTEKKDAENRVLQIQEEKVKVDQEQNQRQMLEEKHSQEKAQLSQQIADLTLQNQSLLTEMAQLKNHLEKSRGLKQSLRDMQGQYQVLQNTIQEKTEQQKKNIDTGITELEKELSEKEDANKRLNIRLSELEQTNQMMNKQVARLQEEKKFSTEQNRISTERTQAANLVMSEIQQIRLPLENEIYKLKQKIKSMEELIKEKDLVMEAFQEDQSQRLTSDEVLERLLVDLKGVKQEIQSSLELIPSK